MDAMMSKRKQAKTTNNLGLGENEIERKQQKRGEVEKQRRDRINYYLSELKNLLPKAIQSEAENKLEKADILQLTVEYFLAESEKKISNKQTKRSSSSSSSSKDRSGMIAVDYREMGYRDCLMEISRYLIEEEGHIINDPDRQRILSYLQYFKS